MENRSRTRVEHVPALQARETAHLPFPFRLEVASEQFLTNFCWPEVLVMNVDAVHTAFGVAFTFVWLLVGQIIVDGR